jgi:hypothetical protein
VVVDQGAHPRESASSETHTHTHTHMHTHAHSRCSALRLALENLPGGLPPGAGVLVGQLDVHHLEVLILRLGSPRNLLLDVAHDGLFQFLFVSMLAAFIGNTTALFFRNSSSQSSDKQQPSQQTNLARLHREHSSSLFGRDIASCQNERQSMEKRVATEIDPKIDARAQQTSATPSR